MAGVVAVAFIHGPAVIIFDQSYPALGVFNDHGGDIVGPINQLREHPVAGAGGGLVALVQARRQHRRAERDDGEDAKNNKCFR